MSATLEQLDQRPPKLSPTRRLRPQPADEELVVEDLLVEDVSIDGMCGVY